MTERSNNTSQEIPYEDRLNSLLEDAEGFLKECAAAIREPLKQEGLEPLLDTQWLTSAPVTIPNRKDNGQRFTFIDEQTEEIVAPKDLRVVFELLEEVAHEKVHLFGKWITGLVPFAKKEAFVDKSPKIYPRLRIKIWDGASEVNERGLGEYSINMDRIAAHAENNGSDTSSLESIDKVLTTAKFLLQTAVTIAPESKEKPPKI